MSVLFILLGVSLVVAGAFLVAFLWSASTGQFDDDYTPSVRMLFDNELKPSTKSKNDKTKHAGRKILL
ncbi:MAG: cbb3-type cytochrome oxidase assembly protein CcoS [Ferruginibacter sp.]